MRPQIERATPGVPVTDDARARFCGLCAFIGPMLEPAVISADPAIATESAWG